MNNTQSHQEPFFPLFPLRLIAIFSALEYFIGRLVLASGPSEYDDKEMIYVPPQSTTQHWSHHALSSMNISSGTTERSHLEPLHIQSHRRHRGREKAAAQKDLRTCYVGARAPQTLLRWKKR